MSDRTFTCTTEILFTFKTIVKYIYFRANFQTYFVQSNVSRDAKFSFSSSSFFFTSEVELIFLKPFLQCKNEATLAEYV